MGSAISMFSWGRVASLLEKAVLIIGGAVSGLMSLHDALNNSLLGDASLSRRRRPDMLNPANFESGLAALIYRRERLGVHARMAAA